MRSMNCRNVRREIQVAGAVHRLSAAVISHLEHCATCETISRQQRDLHKLVSSLGRVEAPADFDLRLRKRLAAEERRNAAQFSLRNISFGLRSAAVAAILLVIVSTFAFVSLRTRPDNAVAGGKQTVSSPVVADSKPNQIESNVKPNQPNVAKAPDIDKPAGSSPVGRDVSNRAVKNELASVRGNRLGTRDQSSTAAGVLRRNDQLAQAYPTAAFPINASYQSLKVSVDDGSGLSRTISLPTVSFGSQRALSNSASPLMASARGTW
jgi:hypothetical protein